MRNWAVIGGIGLILWKFNPNLRLKDNLAYDVLEEELVGFSNQIETKGNELVGLTSGPWQLGKQYAWHLNLYEYRSKSFTRT